MFCLFRRGVGALPSSRLMKSRGSVAPGDETSLPGDESTVDGTGDESEKWLAWVISDSVLASDGVVLPWTIVQDASCLQDQERPGGWLKYLEFFPWKATPFSSNMNFQSSDKILLGFYSKKCLYFKSIYLLISIFVLDITSFTM